MEKYNETVNEVFICECRSVEHQMIVTYDKDWEEVFVHIHLIPRHGIWKRIWTAIKYIFGYKCRYGNFEEFIFKKDDADKLQKIVNYLCV